jgi:hypothetical protein
MSGEWYYETADGVHGPVTGQELLQQANAGVIQQDTPVCKRSNGQWVQAARVNGLITAIKPCPFCAEAILVAAKKCKHCGETIQVPSDDAATEEEPTGQSTATKKAMAFVIGVCGGVGVLLIIGLIVWSICHTQHRERTPEQEKAAVDFSFEGVGFSTTLADFKRQFPDAKMQIENASLGKTSCRWKPKNASSASASFLDNDLESLAIFYDVTSAESSHILDQLCGKFGMWDNSETKGLKTECRWHFYAKDRIVSFSVDYTGSVERGCAQGFLNVTNTKVLMEESAREREQAAKVNTGL